MAGAKESLKRTFLKIQMQKDLAMATGHPRNLFAIVNVSGSILMDIVIIPQSRDAGGVVSPMDVLHSLQQKTQSSLLEGKLTQNLAGIQQIQPYALDEESERELSALAQDRSEPEPSEALLQAAGAFPAGGVRKATQGGVHLPIIRPPCMVAPAHVDSKVELSSWKTTADLGHLESVALKSDVELESWEITADLAVLVDEESGRELSALAQDRSEPESSEVLLQAAGAFPAGGVRKATQGGLHLPIIRPARNFPAGGVCKAAQGGLHLPIIRPPRKVAPAHVDSKVELSSWEMKADLGHLKRVALKSDVELESWEITADLESAVLDSDVELESWEITADLEQLAPLDSNLRQLRAALENQTRMGTEMRAALQQAAKDNAVIVSQAENDNLLNNQLLMNERSTWQRANVELESWDIPTAK